MLRFWGHSDDCAEVDGDIREEIGCEAGPVRFRIGTPAAGLLVSLEYGMEDGAVWSHKIEPIDEDIPVPWSVYFERQHGYSLALVVDCPTGTPMTYARRGPDGWGDEVEIP